MTNDERIDLSTLAPDPGRWNAAVRGTLRRVDEAMARRGDDPFTQIVRWRRRVLAAAAAVIAVVVPAELWLEHREAPVGAGEAVADLSVDALRGGARPSGADLRALLAPAR